MNLIRFDVKESNQRLIILDRSKSLPSSLNLSIYITNVYWQKNKNVVDFKEVIDANRVRLALMHLALVSLGIIVLTSQLVAFTSFFSVEDKIGINLPVAVCREKGGLALGMLQTFC